MWTRKLGALVPLMVAAVLPVTATASGPVETIVQDDALLLHGSDEEVRLGMERSRDLGISRVRLTAGWSVIAPQPDGPRVPDFEATDPAAYPKGNWDHLDRAVRIAHETGLAPMIDIAFWAPRWATREPLGVDDRFATEIDPVHYAAFAEAVARRYSGTWTPPADAPAPPPSSPGRDIIAQILGGQQAPPPPPPEATPAPEPLPRVDTYTIWNEPNHPGFLRPQWAKVDGRWVPRSADIYREMVYAAHPAIKAASPDARVLIGGTASMGSSTPGVAGVPPLRFLRALACVDGALQPVTTGACAGFRPLPGDGWSHHPYSLRTTPDVDTIDRDKLPVAGTPRLAATLRALAGSGRIQAGAAEIWMTEYGYETNRPDPNAPFTLDQQPALLAWAEQIATSVPAVRSWPQFQLYDRPDVAPRPGMREFGDWHSGLYFNDGTPKPAAASYAVPVHASCDRAGWASVWGRLRGHSGKASLVVEARRRHGSWAAITSSRVRRPGALGKRAVVNHGHPVRRFVRHRPGTSYRLRWTAAAGERTSRASSPACGKAAAALERRRQR